MERIKNINIAGFARLVSSDTMCEEVPVSEANRKLVLESRNTIKAILNGEDNRFIVIAGPCSIHDEKSANEYADKFATLRDKYADLFYFVMRVYFEKPRTTIGWKGLISDPYLDGTNNIPFGLKMARKILVNTLNKKVPTATEFLDPIVPQYISDLVSWAAIGARTTESQTHREMSSGLSMPVGFKNNTDGNVQVAVDAMKSASNPHHFLGTDPEGRTAIVSTKGNPGCHIILRGGKGAPNYDTEHVEAAIEALHRGGCSDKLIVDCSHANSGKNHGKQRIAFLNIIGQRASGNKNIVGAMLESHLNDGSQKIPEDLTQLQYGVSITDACISFSETKKLLAEAATKLKSV